MPIDSRLPDFRKLSPAQRLAKLGQVVGLEAGDLDALSRPGALPLEVADGMIENVVGTFELPFAVAANFQINGRDVLVPMVVEEPSIVAAASYMAKLARVGGGFTTSSTGPLMRAQIQVTDLDDPYNARMSVLRGRQQLIDAANAKDKTLIALGGGCRDIEVHVFDISPRGPMIVVHLIVDVRDAMGANTVNTMAETVAPLIERITGGRVRARILSNLADLRLARAQMVLSPEAAAFGDYSGEEVIDRILDLHNFAAVDPYRAATHNKGVMNGIDPVIVATGNDWRAIEAGAHVWACRAGQYRPLTSWEKDRSGRLVGTIEMPMAVGLVGGATKTHPLARLALKIMGVTSAQDLAEIVVTVGLAQNLGAIRALATEGIQRGHMALHARNVAMMAGAQGQEIESVVRQMVADHDVRADRAAELLQALRR